MLFYSPHGFVPMLDWLDPPTFIYLAVGIFFLREYSYHNVLLNHLLSIISLVTHFTHAPCWFHCYEVARWRTNTALKQFKRENEKINWQYYCKRFWFWTPLNVPQRGIYTRFTCFGKGKKRVNKFNLKNHRFFS